jgi:FOG: GAF domain
VTRAAQLAFDAPIAVISLVDETRQWFKSCIGLDVRETARDVSFCDHTIGQSGVYVVPDAQADPLFADNPLVTGAPHIRFYAGAPLVDADGYALGSLCVLDTAPRRFPARERALLTALSACAISAIELHSKSALLDRANTLLQRYVERSAVGRPPA